MMMPGRSYSAQSGYRYGFNGKENDNEVRGEGNQIDYSRRVYDIRLGRFLSVDPLQKKFANLTPYQFSSNDPIESIDLDGLERCDYRLSFVNSNPKLDLLSIGKESYSSGGVFGLFSSTVNIPKHYRVEYNGQHYLFASGGQNSAYASSIKPLPTSTGHLDNVTHDIVYSIAELWAFQNDPASFVKSHVSVEARVNESTTQAIHNGVLQALNDAPITLTASWGFYRGSRTAETEAEEPPPAQQKRVLYHYTNEKGMKGIVSSKTLNASLKANNPNDARYGDGQYLSDIAPGTKSPAQLSQAFLNIPYQGRKFTHYVAIDVTGLNVVKGREGVFVVPNTNGLDLVNRISGSGQVLTPAPAIKNP
jgi:RHS repeat-associated protein